VPNGAFPASITFRFTTASAEAPFRFSYADAGQIALQFRYALPEPPSSTHVQGTSNAFVVRPFGMRISGVTTSASPLHTDAAPYIAGTNFNATVTAVQWKTGDDANNDGVPDSQAQISGNAATLNFGQETSPATATVTHTLNAPAGGAAGTLSGGTFSGFSSGARTGAIAWSEVGFINLFAASSNYLASGQNVTSGAAGLAGVGRFKPDRFLLASRGTLAAACTTNTAFSYLGQAFAINNFQIQARNSAGAITTNYRGNYARFSPTTLAGYNLGARALDGSGTDLTSRIDAGTTVTGSWGASNGVLTASLSPISINRAPPATADTPARFAQARVGIAPVDPDGVALQSGVLDLNVDGAGGNDHQQLVGLSALGNVDLRFGRLRLSSATGAPHIPLRVAARTEYWNGTAFVLNTDDGCTVLQRPTVALSFTAGSGLTACETAMSTASVTLSGGTGNIVLDPPQGQSRGSLVVSPQLGGAAAGSYCPSVGGTATTATAAGMSWLLGRWNDTQNPDGNANTSYDDPPAVRAAFGVYGAQPGSFIFYREIY
jgi:hypothetical protein